jgi:Glycosyl hydrolases family 16
VQLNTYANEPQGAGNGRLINLPAGFDALAAHDWTIRWSLTRIDYLVDGALLASTDTHVPQGPMQINVIAWGPAADWSAAYSASLQPVRSADQNQTFTAILSSAAVTPSSPAILIVDGP